VSEERIKRCLRKARDSALAELLGHGHDVIKSDRGIFDLVAVKKRKVRFIRLADGRISEDERRIVRSFATSSKTISREIWTRRFRKKKIRDNKNRINLLDNPLLSRGYSPFVYPRKDAFFPAHERTHIKMRS